MALVAATAVATSSDARRPPASPPRRPHVAYYGGTVITTPNVLAVYWLPKRRQDGGLTIMTRREVTRNNEVLATLPTTVYFDRLSRLPAKRAGAAAFVRMQPFTGYSSAVVVHSRYPFRSCDYPHRDCVSARAILQVAERAVRNERWALTNQTVVLVYLDPLEEFQAAKLRSWDGYVGVHFGAKAVFTDGRDVRFAIAVVGNEHGPTERGIGIDWVNQAASEATTHELVEAFSDPLGAGWRVAGVGRSESELADYCQRRHALGGHAAATAEPWRFPVASYTVDGRHCAGLSS